MKNKVFIVTLAIAFLIITLPGITMGNENEEPYAFKLQSKSDKQISVQFIGNQMYHDGRYMGYGISGKPMLTLRCLAEWFGFWVDYNAQNRTTLVSKGEYSFQIEPNSNAVEIYWAGAKVKEHELMEKPFIKNGRFHIYSLDLSDLLGLMNNWDNNTRTWDVLYRDYTYQELGFPTAVNDDELIIKGLLFANGQYEMPLLEIMDTINNVHSYTSSACSIDFGAEVKHKYELSSTINLQEENNRLQVSLAMGQRIIFVKNFDVVVNLEDKELVVKQPSYQFTSPTKGYIKVTKPEVIISGSVASINGYYSPEIVLLVKKVDNPEIILKESISIIDGQFMFELELEKETGLYKVTVNSVMAGPRGPAYIEITNFYVECWEGE